MERVINISKLPEFSSPLSGTFFNLSHVFTVYADNGDVFSSPLSGTFFNLFRPHSSLLAYFLFSSPLSGTFFNRGRGKNIPDGERNFRPLYRGLFSIRKQLDAIMALLAQFSSPLSGTFFNQRACEAPARLLSQAHSRRG